MASIEYRNKTVDLLIMRDDNDGAGRPLLRDEASHFVGHAEEDDGIRTGDVRSGHGTVSHSIAESHHSFYVWWGLDRRSPIHLGNVADGGLGFQANFPHHIDGLDWVFADRRLAREHDRIRSIEACVRHVGYFCTGGSCGVCHRLKHLCSRDDRLPTLVCLADKEFLVGRELLERALHSEISTSHHDSIGFLKNTINGFQSLGFLDLGDDLWHDGVLRQRGFHKQFQIYNVLRSLNETQCHKVCDLF
mmetsp:Transcript_12466/g.17385  ORF Transcript_12466/g.17385 Transcript_12466/m.17385 type:complete len:247 (-) Transcript_12466:744-1484(-)